MAQRIPMHRRLDKSSYFEQNTNIGDFGNKTIPVGIAQQPREEVMIYLVSMIVVLALGVGAMAVIWSTLSEHADAVVAALAGQSIRAAAVTPHVRSVRVSIRPAVRRQFVPQPIRAAA